MGAGMFTMNDSGNTAGLRGEAHLPLQETGTDIGDLVANLIILDESRDGKVIESR
jgi:hypothetical protein